MSKAVYASWIVLLLSTPAIVSVGGDSGGTQPRPLAPDFTLALNVTNTLPVPRPDEVLQLDLTLPDGTIADSLNFTVRRQGNGTEVLSGPLNSTVERYPSGFIHRMRIAFQDGFNASERKGYLVTTGNRTALRGDLSWTYSAPSILVYDGNATSRRTYRILVDHTYSYYTTGVRVYYTRTGWPYQAQSGVLVRVAGDQLDVDQSIIQMGWGQPNLRIVDVNNVMVSVRLEYRRPYALHWGYGAMGSWYRTTDLMFANVTINIYNNRSVIDAYVSKALTDKLYNHNGFIMETSLLVAGDGNYEFIYGTPEHTRNWANTTSLNWVQDTGKLIGMDVGDRSAPAAGDLDGDGLLDLLVGAQGGTLTGFRNVGSPTNPVYDYRAAFVPGGGPWDTCASPDLADLDADGDLDLIVGLGNGTVIAFRNTGNVSAPSWARDDALVAGINPPTPSPNAAPELGDLDADGDLDLLVGRLDGTFQFYRNIGSNVTPTWSEDASQFAYLNGGPTRKPGTNATPELADVNRDGIVDLVFGTGFATFGSLIYFQNEGSNAQPAFTKLHPAMFNNVRANVYWTKDFTVPEIDDFDGDGFEDIVLGANDGDLQYWDNAAYTQPERHANIVQPLENGSWRFFYDQDGNDGQYVTRNYTSDFYGWYVVSNPRTNQAIFRYVPDFSQYAYRDRYSGEMYPWAGGNTSYYPFLPGEDGRITRGMLLSRCARDATLGGYGVGGTYLTQTGTAGGYIKAPMAARDHRSHELLVMELPYDPTAALYDTIAETVRTPLVIEAPADLTLLPLDLTTDPTDPATDMNVTVTANVRNVGFNDSVNVTANFYDGDPATGGLLIGSQLLPLVRAGEVVSASVAWNTTGISGTRDVYVVLDGAANVTELDEDNNVQHRSFAVTRDRRTWSEEYLVSPGPYNDMDPTMAVDALGRIWLAWHDFATKENYNLYATNFDGTSWGQVEAVVEGYKHTGMPALAGDPNGDLWMIFSSNVIEYDNYIATRSAIYYWSCKFDIYATRRAFDGWQTPTRITRAVEFEDSDQAPFAAFTPDGTLWTTFRQTDFELYKVAGGTTQQIVNIPLQDYNISAMSFDGASWSGEQFVDHGAGSQGFWNGASLAVGPDGTLWTFYEAETSSQWDVYYAKNDGSGWTAPARLTTDAGNDIRPMAAFDASGHLFLVWDSDRYGSHDLFVRYYNGTSWTADSRLTTDPGHDLRPAIARDPSGLIYVTWESNRSGNKDIFLKTFNGTAWSPDFQVTTDPAADEHATVIGMPSGGAMIAWESDRNGIGNLDIYVKSVSISAANVTLPRPGPSDLRAELDGAAHENVRLTWNLSVDDWRLGTVTGYVVRCGNAYDRTGASYSDVASVSAGVDTAIVPNRGHRDPDHLFCQVVAESGAGRSAPSNQAGAYKVPLADRHLVSVPLIPASTSPDAFLAPLTNIPSNFTVARTYVPNDAVDPWKAYLVSRGKEIPAIGNDVGIWIAVSGPDQLTVAGVVPVLTRVALRAGWNLVGYPSLTPRTVADALAGLPVLRVEGFDATAPPYNLRVLGGGDLMMPGQGYWIYVSSDATWSLLG